jgi:3-hydroxyisobutyrate dehydrogenase-like beta-hydroxyacid dehydrogenase
MAPDAGFESAGLLGLGNMGAALAQRLLAQGTALHVYDPNHAALARAASLGAVVHGSCQSVADAAAIVIGCVASVSISADVAAQAAAGSAIRCYVEMSTIGPDAARSLDSVMTKKSIGFIDAAISGGAAAAIDGSLAIMVAGRPQPLSEVRSLLGRISERIFVIGDEPGQAQSMKLINNLLAAANMANAFEALVLGVKLGLEPAQMVRVINAGSGRSMALVERRVAAILSRRFDSGPKIALLHKDIGLALEVAGAAGFPLAQAPALTGAATLWQRAVERGMESEDVTALIRLVEDAAGVVVAARPA